MRVRLSVRLAFVVCALALCVLTGVGQRQVGLQSKPTAAGASQKRVALVIGNGNYQNVGKLRNPVNDARAMAAELQKLGFEVGSVTDADQRTIKRMVREFGEKLRTTRAAGLFYYAGHGVQINNKNYLIPVEIDVANEADVEDQAVDVQYVLGSMNAAGNRLNIVILDACRNNPFMRSLRSASEGLAQVDAPTGTLIAYATAPGRAAWDGDGVNSPYTEELLKQMRVAGLSEADVFKNVRAAVVRRTQGTRHEQVPWESSSLIGTFYFNPTVPRPTPLPATLAQLSDEPERVITRRSATELEREAWLLIRNSNDPQDFREFLATYANGANAENARIKLEQLVWTITRADGSKMALEAYLKEFPTGDHVPTARLLLSRLMRAKQPLAVAPPDSIVPQQNNESVLESTVLAVAPPSNEPAAEPVVGTVRQQDLGRGIKMSFAWIPEGSFLMGSENGGKDEKPVHSVTVSKGFWMQITEVTQEQWNAVMGATLQQQKEKVNFPLASLDKDYGEGAKNPMYYVSWDDAQGFVRRMNERKDGYLYSLPTEAQWEYAARANTTGDYAGLLDAMAWYSANSKEGTQKVGTRVANTWGLYDMHGNVWEWCEDTYLNSYTGVPTDGTAYNGISAERIVRGGAWLVNAHNQRSANRNKYRPSDRLPFLGFRIVARVRTEFR